MSRRHAAICYDGEKETWSIKDHKSTNGVIVDGNAIQPLKETALSDGQTVQLGPDSDFAWTFRLVRLRNKTKKHELPEEEEPSGPRAKRPRLSSPSLDSNKAVIEKLRTKFNEELSCTICNEVFIQVSQKVIVVILKTSAPLLAYLTTLRPRILQILPKSLEKTVQFEAVRLSELQAASWQRESDSKSLLGESHLLLDGRAWARHVGGEDKSDRRQKE